MNSGCIGTYDAAGNMTEGPAPDSLTDTHKYIYDAWNRLAKVTDDAQTPATIAEYQYDGLGRRIVKSVYASGSVTHRMHYYYDGWQVIEERKEVTGTEDTDPLAQYVWRSYYIDAPVLRWYDANTDEKPECPLFPT